MIYSVLLMSMLSAVFGAGLVYAARRFHSEADPTTNRIDELLPQTQCGQCGFPGCRPYAEAIVAGKADINRCPPGGEATIHALANLLGRDTKSLDKSYGQFRGKGVAVIIEAECIGCTLCIQACPVDAILGAAKQMHTVISSECTGCELCVAPCPVDCIEMAPVRETVENWIWSQPRKSYMLRQ